MRLFKILTGVALIAAACMVTPTESKAQFSNFLPSKTTTASGADTITGNINYPASLVTSATVTMLGVSGTAGRIVMFGSNMGNTYTRLDSVTVSYIGGNSTKDWDFNKVTSPTKFPGAPDWYKYRFVFYQTAGSVSAVTGRALTRTP